MCVRDELQPYEGSRGTNKWAYAPEREEVLGGRLCPAWPTVRHFTQATMLCMPCEATR